MYAIIAFIPIIVTIIVMAGFNWPAKIALPLAWLITAIVCFAAWKMDIITIAAQTIAGFLGSIDTIVIIFGAILIMNTLKQSGGMGVINRMFTNVSDDPRIQMVIIGFMFGAFIEGAAGCSAWQPPLFRWFCRRCRVWYTCSSCSSVADRIRFPTTLCSNVCIDS